MNEKNNIKVLCFNAEGSVLIKWIKHFNNCDLQKKIILKENILSFYYTCRENIDRYNIYFIDLTKTNESTIVDVFKQEIKSNDNIIVFGNHDEVLAQNLKQYILLNNIKYTDVIINKKITKVDNFIDKTVISKEIVKFYISKLINTDDCSKGMVYVSEKSPIKRCGFVVYDILREYKELYSQKEIVLNIISGEKLYLDTLSYITDPILEYTNEHAKIKIKNIISKELNEDFIVSVLGVQ